MASPDTQVRAKDVRLRSPSVSTSTVILVVVLLTTAAALLRLYKLGAWSFWVDEMFTIRDAIGPGVRFHGMTYPLSYMLIAGVLQTLGLNEWNARIVPAIFGIITPALIYLMARRSFGDVAAAIAAGLVVLSPWHLYWSQMSRFYTMTLFFSAAALFAFHRGLEENRRWYMAAAGVLLALGTLSHYSALLLIPGVALYLIALRWLRWPRPAGANPLNLLIALSPFILGAVVAGTKASSLFARYLGGHQTGTVITDPLTGAAYVFMSLAYRLELTVVVLAIAAFVIGFHRKDRGILLMGCATLVTACIMSVFGAMSHAENRYAFVSLAPTAVLAGSMLSAIASRLWACSRAMAALVVVIAALPMLQHDVSYFGRVSNGERWNYRAAAQYVRSHGSSGEKVYSSMRLPLQYYLKGSGMSVLTLYPDRFIRSRPSGRVWIVLEDATRGESVTKELDNWMKTNTNLEAHYTASSPAADYGLSVYSLRDQGNDTNRETDARRRAYKQ